MEIGSVYKTVARKLLPLREIIVMRIYDLCGRIFLFCVSFEISVAYISNWADCCFWMYFFSYLYLQGYFILPTVITGLPDDSRVNQEEIFGPVVTITPFSTEEEVKC